MKTIDAVIEQCEEIANASKQHTFHMTHFSQSYDEWAEEWIQIAEWLKELKAYKEQGGDVIGRKELLNDIDMAIKATNMDDAYSIGMRNGMRVIKAFIDDEKPEYEKCCHEESHSEIPNTCEDAISREAMLNGLASIAKAKARSDAQKSLMGRVMFFTEHLPSVTPQQRTGRWEKEGQGGRYKWMCSNCGTHHRALYDYCPSCGAKMEEVNDD